MHCPRIVNNHKYFLTYNNNLVEYSTISKGNMKTITLTFVIDDDQEKYVESAIEESLTSYLNPFPMFGWFSTKPTKKEIAWRKKYDNDDR